MSYTVEYTWTNPKTGEEHKGTMGPFSTEQEANIMVDTVGKMLDIIAEHWGAYVEEASA